MIDIMFDTGRCRFSERWLGTRCAGRLSRMEHSFTERCGLLCGDQDADIMRRTPGISIYRRLEIEQSLPICTHIVEVKIREEYASGFPFVTEVRSTCKRGGVWKKGKEGQMVVHVEPNCMSASSVPSRDALWKAVHQWSTDLPHASRKESMRRDVFRTRDDKEKETITNSNCGGSMSNPTECIPGRKDGRYLPNTYMYLR